MVSEVAVKTVREFIKAGAGEYYAIFGRRQKYAELVLIGQEGGQFFKFEGKQKVALRVSIEVEDTVTCITVPEGGIACDGTVLIIEAHKKCARVRMYGCTRPLAEFCSD